MQLPADDPPPDKLTPDTGNRKRPPPARAAPSFRGDPTKANAGPADQVTHSPRRLHLFLSLKKNVTMVTSLLDRDMIGITIATQKCPPVLVEVHGDKMPPHDAPLCLALRRYIRTHVP